MRPLGSEVVDGTCIGLCKEMPEEIFSSNFGHAKIMPRQRGIGPN
jgi:hypothetical protein